MSPSDDAIDAELLDLMLRIGLRWALWRLLAQSVGVALRAMLGGSAPTALSRERLSGPRPSAARW